MGASFLPTSPAKASRPEIFFGTVLLEINRWKPQETHRLKVSDWLERIRQAGFDGIELWERHFTKADAAEQAVLSSLKPFVAIFNAYIALDSPDENGWDAVRQAVERTGARAVKFNFGSDPQKRDLYLAGIRKWASSLPPGVRLLCECHGGTIAETPSAARDLLAELEGVPVGVIVHAFAPPVQRLAEWFDALGPKIAHVHVAARDEKDRMISLDGKSEQVRCAMQLLKDAGFAGTYTLEFTEGIGSPDENPEISWTRALSDLETLRELTA